MPGYTKLFNRILESTIWREDDKTRILWITMLAMADKDGVVESTIPGLADRARISLGDCEVALERFQQPDKYSWSKEEEGRRIRIVDGGWFLINHEKYRKLLSLEDQREKTRLRVERWRSGHAVTQCNDAVTLCDAGNDKHIQKQKHIQRQEKSKALRTFVRPVLEDVIAYCLGRENVVDPRKWFDYYESNGWRVGRNPMKDWKAAVRTWEKNGFSSPRSGSPQSVPRDALAIKRQQEAEARARGEID